MATQQPAI